jgi:hypothetical protein
MQKLVSTIAGLTLLVSIISSGMPGVTHAADTANGPPPSWPHTIVTDDATIVVYQPQAVAWQEYRTLETREAVAVTKKGAKTPVLGTLEASVDTQTDSTRARSSFPTGGSSLRAFPHWTRSRRRRWSTSSSRPWRTSLPGVSRSMPFS